jgi:hypothetical protein
VSPDRRNGIVTVKQCRPRQVRSDICHYGRLSFDICDPQTVQYSRTQYPCGLRRESAAACLLGLWVRIPPGAWMSVCCGCCVLSGRGLCDELVPRPEESCWV